jgi:hypothetical protein
MAKVTMVASTRLQVRGPEREMMCAVIVKRRLRGVLIADVPPVERAEDNHSDNDHDERQRDPAGPSEPTKHRPSP